MTAIIGIENFSTEELEHEIMHGGRFVQYQYCISIIALTIKQQSPIYFIPSGQNAFSNGIKYSLITLFFGWWGIPWGLAWSFAALTINCYGGENLTDQILSRCKKIRDSRQDIVSDVPKSDWTCLLCSGLNPMGTVQCSNCNADSYIPDHLFAKLIDINDTRPKKKAPTPSNVDWKCPLCAGKNPKGTSLCRHCSSGTCSS